MIPSVVLAIDPGRDKCGIAVVAHQNQSEKIHLRRVVPAGQMRSVIEEVTEMWPTAYVVLGDSTASLQWQAKIEEWLPQTIIFRVDERNSSYEARVLYWQTHPPRGWRRILPLSLQEPPEPIDDFAAVVLARRFLQRLENQASEGFKGI